MDLYQSNISDVKAEDEENAKRVKLLAEKIDKNILEDEKDEDNEGWESFDEFDNEDKLDKKDEELEEEKHFRSATPELDDGVRNRRIYIK